jgi:TonB-linked SusC/RagA family outer membrane protein
MRRLASAALAALALAFAPGGAAAQGGEVAGVVLSSPAQQPVAGAQVTVTGTTLRVLTDAAGRFAISGVGGTQATLTVQRLGFQRVTRTVRVGDTSLRISLAESALSLDALVATGTAGGTQRRAIGTTVAKIDAAQVVATAPVNSVQDLLNGRAPGVVVIPGTGMVGGGARIRVRGVSSLSLAQEPLIYIDGVRVDNRAATGPINQGFGSSVISRFDDLDPQEIESIEIIKGPAASTLYGTEASHGVVQITTKHGQQGGTRFDLHVKQGANWFQNPEGRVWNNYGVNPLTGQVDSLNMVRAEDQRGHPIWQNGRVSEYNLGASGGSPTVRYFVGGGLVRDEGIEPNNTVHRFSGRANVAATPSAKVDINASLGYTSGRTSLGLEAGGGGAAWTTFFATPANLNTPRRGFHSALPEAYRSAYQDWQDVNRFTGSVQLKHKPASWFTHRVTVGTDLTRENNVELVQRIGDPQVAQFFSAAEIRGYRDQTMRTVSYNTLDYSATAAHDFGRSLSSETSVGTQYYRRYSEFVSAYGEEFPAPGLRAITATARQRASQDYVEDVTVGVFAQQQLGWKDRFYLTGAIRADDNSAFGRNFDLVYYPKVSASWVVSEEPFWRFGPVNTLKLRAAYGETGQQPASFTALRTFSGVPGPGDSITVTPQALGNPDLGPERSGELEAGFDAGFLNDRLGLELTYYSQNTHDAILLRQSAPSSGFPGEGFVNGQYINAGHITNSGIEAVLRATAFDRPRFGLDLSFSLATNHNKVVSLGLPGRDFVTAGSFVQHHEGYPVGAWFERRVVDAQFDAAGKLVRGSEMCDDGKGGTVACASAPLVFLGRPTPSTEGSFTANVRLFRSLRLSSLVDFKHGFSKLDGNLRVRCTLFGRCRENFYPLDYVGTAQSRAWLAQTQNTAYVSGLISDASFTKLREVSATYSFPTRWAGRLGADRASLTLAGRNLHTWTDYKGMEPESSFLGGSRGGASAQWEQNVVPQLAQFVASLNFSF